jgi:PAS domain S-box-containing protein
MKLPLLTNILLDQSKDLFWVVNSDFKLVYANERYQSLIKKITGKEHKLLDSAFTDYFGTDYIEKWKTYYTRALCGEYFEVEDHHFNPESNKIEYGLTTLEPLRDDDNKVFAVACQSKDITRIVKQRSEANQLMDASLDVFCTINEQGNFVNVSAAALNHWGYAPEELSGKPYMDYILEEDVPKTNEISAAILSGQEIKSFTNRYKKKDGSIAYNLWSARWDNEAKLMYCVARDGKEKLEQEVKIQQSEQRYKALVQEGSDMVTILDIAGNYKFVSPTNQVVLGIAPDEYIGKNAFQFIHPDDEERTLASLHKVTTTKKVIVKPYRFLNYKKEWRWIETVLTNMIDDPVINGIISNSRDITEKIKQDELIQQSEQRFKSLVQEGSDMISIIDADGKYIYTSPTTTLILGITPEEFKGRNVFDFIHPDDADTCLASLKKIYTEDRVIVPAFRLLNNKKEWRWIESVLTNMMDNPAVRGVVANSRDITETVNNQKQLELNQTHLANAQQVAKVGSWETNLKDLTVTWSDETYRIFGIINDGVDMTHEKFLNNVHPLDREKVNQALKDSFKDNNKSHHLIEHRILTKTGIEKVVEERWSIDFDDKGNPLLAIGSCQDITERKKAEEERNSLQITLENSLNEIYIFDEETFKFIYVNLGALRNLGYYDNEIETLTPLDLKPDFTLASFKNLLSPLINNAKKEIIFFTSHKRKDGSLYPVEVHLQLVSVGNKRRFVAIVLDITERKKAEENIRLVNERLQLATLATNLGIWDWDVVNNSLIWDKTMYSIFGVDEYKFTGAYEAWAATVHPDDIAKGHEDVQSALNDGKKFDVEFRIVWPDKSVRYIKGDAIVIRDNAGKPLRMIGTNHDITERIKAEKEIRDSDKKRRLIMNGSLDAIISINTDGNITFWNLQAEIIFGWKEAEVMGQPLSELIIPEQFRKYHKEGMKHYLETGEEKILNKLMELKAINRKGKEFPIELTIIDIQQGQELFFTAFLRDITKRKNAEEELKFKANLLSTIGQAAIATDLSGVVNYWNKAAESIYGWSLEEAVGQNIMDLTTLDPNKEKAMQIMERLKKGETWSGNFKMQKKNGTDFIALVSNSPVYDENNILSGIIGVSTDVTQQIKNEELLKHYTVELERSNEELEQFAFVASHDLQEPLRMISSFMDLLKRNYKGHLDEKAHRYIDFATDGAKRMKQIILDLLEYSITGKPTEGKEEVDFNKVISEFIQLRRNLISEKRASITFQNLPTLFIYKAAIVQILHCLLDNALKYSKSDMPAVIKVNTKQNESEWEFSVQDNGIGIDPQFCDKIFIIFQRLHNKTEYEGTGIGLSIAKRHVEFLGGRIWVESILGEGSVFYFTIPMKN